MITELLLFVIAAVAIGGIYYAFFYIDDEIKRRKMVTIVAVVIIAMTASLFIFNDKARDVETQQGAMISTLQQLLGYSTRGFNPYDPDTWGGLEPLQDFDYDGVQNIHDNDRDSDGLDDKYEMQSMYNPMAPDMGIERMEVTWPNAGTIHLKVYPTYTSSGAQAMLAIYLDGEETPLKEISNFQNSEIGIDITFKYDTTKSHTLDLIVTGTESRYANKANNYLSYNIPANNDLFFIGKVYSDIESQIQGVIRNAKFIPGTVPLFSAGGDILRDGIAGIPLWGIVIVIIFVLVVIYLIWKNRRIKSGKEPFKEKKPGLIRRILIKLKLIKPPEPRHKEFQRGDINVEMWRRKRRRVKR